MFVLVRCSARLSLVEFRKLSERVLSNGPKDLGVDTFTISERLVTPRPLNSGILRGMRKRLW